MFTKIPRERGTESRRGRGRITACLWICLAFLYSVLLVSFLWLPHTAPRELVRLRVADNGGFTLTSWRKSGAHDIALELWQADLSTSRRLPVDDYVASFAHAIGSEGRRIAFVVSDGTDTRIVITDRHGMPEWQWEHEAKNKSWGLATNIAFAGKDSGRLLYNAHPWVYQIGMDGDALHRVPAHMTSATFNGPFAIAWEARPPEGQKPNGYNEKQVACFYKATPDGFVLLREVEGLDWRFSGYAISRQGTIAIQREGYITLEQRDKEQRRISFSDELGTLLSFSPDERFLLFRKGDSYLVVNSENLAVENRYRVPEVLSSSAGFQDHDHLLIGYEIGGDVSDRIVRWNWRTGKATERALGGIEEGKRQIWRRAESAGLVLFLALALPLCAAANEPWKPAVVAVGLVAGALAWAYNHPDFGSYVLASHGSLPEITGVVGWLAVGCLASLALFMVRRRFLAWLSVAIAVIALAAYQVATLRANSGWFFPLALASATCTILVTRLVVHLLAKLRRSGPPVRQRGSRDNSSVRLVDLFFLMAAAAVTLAVTSRLGAFDQTVASYGQAVLYGALLGCTTLFACWAAIGTWRWWVRYPVAIGTTVACVFFLSTRIWGAELALYTALLGFVIWFVAMLFRGNVMHTATPSALRRRLESGSDPKQYGTINSGDAPHVASQSQ